MYILSLLGRRGIRDHECTNVCMLILPVDVEGGRDHQGRHQVHEHTQQQSQTGSMSIQHMYITCYVYMNMLSDLVARTTDSSCCRQSFFSGRTTATDKVH